MTERAAERNAHLQQVASVVESRLPWASLGLVVTFLAIWPIESAAHPGRLREYATLLAVTALTCLGAIAVLRKADLAPRARLLAASVAVAALLLQVGGYHLWVRGELEVLALVLIFLSFAAATLFPWGLWPQLLVASTGLAIYLVAPAAGVHVSASGPIDDVVMALILGLTAFVAGFEDRARRLLLGREQQLEREAAERRRAERAMEEETRQKARLIEQLERAHRTKSELVATLSHELRTPVHIILGYLELLLDGQVEGRLRPQQVETLERVNRHALDLFELITSTLDLSRLEAGRAVVHVQPIDLSRMLSEITAETRELVAPRVRFTVEELEGADVLHSDPYKLKVVIKNLVANALKFTERGEVRVIAQARVDGLDVLVRDSGIGIPAQAQAQIFEAFSQIDSAAGQGRGGVGLGLFIVRRLVEGLGGRVGLESAPGEGSTFRVWVPTRTSDAAAGDGSRDSV